MEWVEYIESLDICSTCFPVFLMLVAGQWLVTSQTGLRDMGARVGIMVFASWLVTCYVRDALGNGNGLFVATARGVLLGTVGTAIVWIIGSIIWGIRNTIVDPLLQRWMDWETSSRQERAIEAQRREEQETRRRAAEVWERDAPRREAERLAAEEHDRQEAETRTRSQKRRDDARAHCELLFTLHAPEIGSRFSRKMFASFTQKYMGDDRAPEEVEERAGQLERILQEHRTAIRPPQRFKDIEELAAWYVAEKQRIETLPIEEMFREQQKVQLTTLYSELTQQVLEQA